MDANINNLPEIDKVYAFYDDGKCGYSRQYLAKVNRIIPIEDTKTIMIEGVCCDDNDKEYPAHHSLYDYWKYNFEEATWVYASETDYLIECSIPKYDTNPIYFARTKKGEWFSMDVQCWWQSGFLDITGINDEYLKNELKEKRDKNIL